MRAPVPILLLSIFLLGGAMACAPMQREPAALSERGYNVKLHIPERTIWIGPLDPGHPQSTEVIVRVHDVQGRPVDGVPVMFYVEPSWASGATLLPAQMLTHRGEARAVFQAQTTGVVRVGARVDNVMRESTITIQSWSRPGNS